MKAEILTLELIKPARDALKGGAAADIINKQSTEGTAVVSGGDGSEAFLAGGVPDLRLHLLAVDVDALSLELHSDGGLGVEIELVASIARQQIGFANRRVPYDYNLEEILLSSILHFLFFSFLFTSKSQKSQYLCYYFYGRMWRPWPWRKVAFIFGNW